MVLAPLEIDKLNSRPPKKPQLRSAGHFLTLNNCRNQEKWHLFQRQTLKYPPNSVLLE